MESEHFSDFASGNSDRYSVAVSTVFDDGPWVDMCSFLGMATSPGSMYGRCSVSLLSNCTAETMMMDCVVLKS